MLKINGKGHRNDDKEQGGGIGLARPTFNHIPEIQIQRRTTVGFDDTSNEDVDFVEFVNPRGIKREGRQWQPNYRGDDKYKLKVDIPHFSGYIDIDGFFDWFTKVDRFFENIEFLEDRIFKFVAYRLKVRASV